MMNKKHFNQYLFLEHRCSVNYNLFKLFIYKSKICFKNKLNKENFELYFKFIVNWDAPVICYQVINMIIT